MVDCRDTGQVVAELAEFAFESSDPRFVPALRSGTTSRVSAGQLWTDPGKLVRWRSLAVLKDGRIVFSENRQFRQ